MAKSNRPIRTTADLLAGSGGGGALCLGEAHSAGVATVCDAAEGVFDRKRAERIGIVVACPLLEKGMVRMRRISQHFEQLVEAGDAAAILGRPVSFARRRGRRSR